jgi:hypothetical protein
MKEKTIIRCEIGGERRSVALNRGQVANIFGMKKLTHGKPGAGITQHRTRWNLLASVKKQGIDFKNVFAFKELANNECEVITRQQVWELEQKIAEANNELE